jgi:hypothetical protein
VHERDSVTKRGIKHFEIWSILSSIAYEFVLQGYLRISSTGHDDLPILGGWDTRLAKAFRALAETVQLYSKYVKVTNYNTSEFMHVYFVLFFRLTKE